MVYVTMWEVCADNKNRHNCKEHGSEQLRIDAKGDDGMLRIAVCDDEPIFQNKLSEMLRAQLGQYCIDCDISCFGSGGELVKAARERLDYDIAFLDISMEGMDGLETAKRLRMFSPGVHIVFVTAFITYALEGYKVDAVRYLLKDGENLGQSLKECLDTIIEKMGYKEQRVTFRFQSGSINLPTDRILYMESRLHRTVFFVLEKGVKEYYLYEKLDDVQEKLCGMGFCRIHQSFLVNMKHVREIKRYMITLSDGTEISVSKKYYKTVENEYIRLKGDI